MLLNQDIITLVKEKNNFNLIRFFLAYSVMFNHFSALTQTDPFWLISGGMRVKGFFIISGFLVMFSFIRTPDLKIFAQKRIRRLMPAYLLTIVICAIGGLFITSLPVKEYLTSGELYRYLIANGSTLNFLQTTLPGVFETNPYPQVNVSLWTIKVEIMLYACIPLLALLFARYKKPVIFVVVYLLSYLYFQTTNYLYDTTGMDIFIFLRRQFLRYLMYFCSGIILLLYFDLFKKYLYYLLPVSIILLLFRHHFILQLFEPISLSCLIIGFAYSLNQLHFIGKIGNFSYGIFLFHCPIIQCLIYFNIHQYNWTLALIITTLLSTVLGMLSWHYIEKPWLYKEKKVIDPVVTVSQ